MTKLLADLDMLQAMAMAGPAMQCATAVIAALIGIMTFRYTKRQSALALINYNNTMANTVNTTVIQFEQARQTFRRLQDPIVGCPDDAMLFLYINYVHNAFRMYQLGAVSRQVWTDTLGSCAAMLGRLRRDQVERLLSRGYEMAFQTAVLARWDAASEPAAAVDLRPRPVLRAA